VYVSSAVELFTPEALTHLLERARHRNAHLDITGMLLYKDGNFMQALEGPAPAVRALFRIIRRDPRHKNILTLLQHSTQERHFPEWSMGFGSFGEPAHLERDGYSDFLNQSFDSSWFREEPTRAQSLLLSFRKYM
jgi:hypothetical protein